MPDISMCHGVGCAERDTCYRHVATPNPELQSWAFFDSARESGKPCEYRLGVEDREGEGES